ncbi:uncharacterized protein LOC110988464 isoform X2 [Acanthaster planci]|nr:uncharacterized protein LOC110988464 isoform X2 [Acanthaster planci]
MTPFSVFLSLVAASGFLIYDLRTAQEILRLEKDAIPITTFRKFLMASATGDNPVSLKLHLWDNGGDSVYQSMQQFFRPTEAVYLLVFSLEDARQDEEKQLQRLRQWLFTIKAQSKRIQDSQENEESDPNTLIFVVGTHRDSVSKDFLSHFAGKIDEALYKDFCCILAINGDKGPLYVVENSKVMDQDGIHLRSSVIRLAKKTSYMKELFPIRHLRILNKVRDRQSRGLLPWIMKISDLLQDIAEENMSVAELQQVLVSLHRTGDVIYRYDDQVLNRYVVVSPGVLMDVLQAIVSIPQRESRKRSQARDWLDLETKGIVSQNLIQTIVGPDDTLLPCLRLMEAYNLLIPVYSSALMSCPQTPSLQEQDTDPSLSLASGQLPNYCILPSHLPDFTGEEADFWVPAEDDEVYIFDFKHVSPKPIFHRLLAKLWCERDIQDSKHESVFKTRGRFRLKGTNLYVVRLQQITCSQNTIEVTIHHNISNNRCNLQVLQYLRGLLEEIRCMDFPELPYTCGPICDTCSSDGLLKILKICGHDEAFPIANMQCKAFMQEGRYHEVHLTPQLKVTCGKRRTSSCVSSDSACSLTPRDGRSSSFINELVVGENSDRMTVIGEVHNSTFNMQRTEASPYDTNAQNSEGTTTRERAGDTLQ